MSGSIVLGVDGGGSSTVAWVAESAGRILARAEAGPSNMKAVGEGAALSAVDAAIRAALSDAGAIAGSALDSVDVACLGLAGCDREADRAILARWNDARGWARRLIVVNDAELVLAAGTPEGWGVAVIAGTGSIVVGRSEDGRMARAGGWGHVFGDEGSGYMTAANALRLVAHRHDGRTIGHDRPDALTEAVCEAVGVPDPSCLVSAIYAPGFDRARVAAVAAAVVRAADRDPTIARKLLAPAGNSLDQAAWAVARRLNLPRDGLPLAMAGGFLLSADSASRSLLHGLEGYGYRTDPRPVDDPVRGALILARRAAQDADKGGPSDE